jgi:dipeptidyl aminopeptidase/acylaminoacyl peptidase
VGESFVRSPEIAVIREGKYTSVKSFDLGYLDHVTTIDVEYISWKAPDGLEIQGWLLRPKDQGPCPVVMSVHGGPVWHSRPVWLGRRGAALLMLAKRGYGIVFPNARGSTGRGQDFARHILGDMGGKETDDFLSCLDFLVDRGVADPDRLGVTGGSYGGFMTSWLITQDDRFAAAVAVAPITNHVTEHLISNIPHFVSAFVGDRYYDSAGRYFQRSPIMHAHKASTPTLSICGALDRCTPPEEAKQFHSALLENGTESVLVIYPQEGHGIRKFPAAIDYAARIVLWFETHLSRAS